MPRRTFSWPDTARNEWGNRQLVQVPTRSQLEALKSETSHHFKFAVAHRVLQYQSAQRGAPSSPQPVERSSLKTLQQVCGYYNDYLCVQWFLYGMRPDLEHHGPGHRETRTDEQLQRQMEEDLTDLLGNRGAQEFKSSIDRLESNFEALGQMISIDARNPHLNKFATKFSSMVRTLLRTPRQPDNMTAMNADNIRRDTRAVLEIFKGNLKRAEWDGFREFQNTLEIAFHDKKDLGTFNVTRDLHTRNSLASVEADLRTLMGLIQKMDYAQLGPILTDLSEIKSVSIWPMASGREGTGRATTQEETVDEPRDDLFHRNSANGADAWEDKRRYIECSEVRSEFFAHESKVESADFQPAGMYRGVCKLLITSRVDQDEAHPSEFHSVGSGWVYDSQTVVTAGHNVRNRHAKHGNVRAVDIEVWLGYNQASRPRPGARPQPGPAGHEEMQKASWVLTRGPWYDKFAPQCDMAVIRLKRPLLHPGQFSVVGTVPRAPELDVRIVGYPGSYPAHFRDKNRLTRRDAGKLGRGRAMCQSRCKIPFSYADVERLGLVRYHADTAKGTSGSPVLLKNEHTKRLEVIAVHVRGGKLNGVTNRYDPNEGVRLGSNGNNIPEFVEILTRAQNGEYRDQLPDRFGAISTSIDRV